MFKKAVIVSSIVLGSLTLGACDDTIHREAHAVEQQLPSGKSVTCVLYNDKAISCDWANVH